MTRPARTCEIFGSWFIAGLALVAAGYFGWQAIRSTEAAVAYMLAPPENVVSVPREPVFKTGTATHRHPAMVDVVPRARPVWPLPGIEGGVP
jgi:hypothetical protein